MTIIKEVLYQHTKNVSNRRISRALGISRTTIHKYLKLAYKHGFNKNMNSDQFETISIKVYEVLYINCKIIGKAMNILEPHKDTIQNLLAQSNITHTQIHRLLSAQDIAVSKRSIDRFIQANFPKPISHTVHITTTPAKEAQVDFGYVGLMRDENGKDRKTYAFIMTLSHSRHR